MPLLSSESVTRFRALTGGMLLCWTLWAGDAFAEPPELAAYFGFDPVEVIKIADGAGPIVTADMDGDGFTDLIAANNHASRIEIHHQRPGATPDTHVQPPSRPNEFPEHWRFRRQLISVTHNITAIVPYDFDEDGDQDLIYAARSGQLVFLRQAEPGRFEIAARHRVRNLAANRDGLCVVDVLGNARPELIALVNGSIHIWTPSEDDLGKTVAELNAGDPIVAIVPADYDGDGRTDLLGVIPEHTSPLRLWRGQTTGGVATLGPQIRFESPGLREATTLRLPGVPAAMLATIERASKRIVVSRLERESIESAASRRAALHVHGFADAGNRKRDVTLADLDGDGLLDLLATDTQANTLVAHLQSPGSGLGNASTSPTYAELTAIAAGNVDEDPQAEVFVLSEEESVVGRSDVTPEGAIPYPQAIALSQGQSPVAMNLINLEDGPRLAVVGKSGRNYAVDIIDMHGGMATVSLGSQSRAPESIIGLDADHDGRTELLVFTPDKPMIMLDADDEGYEVIQSDDMGQFGLVRAAQSRNTLVADVDGDGAGELLIADKNFVRAVRYLSDPADGVSAGWQVVTQINASDSSAELVSLAGLGARIVAADRENGRLLVLGRDEDGMWREQETLDVEGFTLDEIKAGALAGHGTDNILAIDKDGFAIIKTSGERFAFEEVDSWRTPDEHRLQHELASGDVNGDGFTDLVSLDAGEQMCEILTFSESQHLHYAMGFPVFESRIFSGGDSREFEPSVVLIDDLTGDGAADLILLAHDRVLLYPQMTRP